MEEEDKGKFDFMFVNQSACHTRLVATEDSWNDISDLTGLFYIHTYTPFIFIVSHIFKLGIFLGLVKKASYQYWTIGD